MYIKKTRNATEILVEEAIISRFSLYIGDIGTWALGLDGKTIHNHLVGVLQHKERER
jgi:hypothetical protein